MDEKRILIVEDEPRIALALSRALEHRPPGEYRVEISPMAETAMSKMQGKPFDLVVTDMRMPGMGGLALIRHLRQHSPQTSTMLITAFGSPEIKDAAQRLGATYLPKPFSLQEFISRVQHILDYPGPETSNLPRRAG